MALTTEDDISVVLSGAINNIDPDLSLGGEPSSVPINSGVLNNLFRDIDLEESEGGFEDYRCVYLFNDGPTTVYDISIYLLERDSQNKSKSVLELGIDERDEFQRITLSGGVITGGSISIDYDGEIGTISYNSDLGEWALDIQNFLNTIVDGSEPILSQVQVSGSTAGSEVTIFDINFFNRDGKKDQPKLEVTSNLTPVEVAASVLVIQEGSPVNTQSTSVGVETTPPGGVGFFVPTQASPVSIPRLRPTEGFPLWFKRTIPAGSPAQANDGDIVMIKVASLPPA